jgi:hypothetical protein
MATFADFVLAIAANRNFIVSARLMFIRTFFNDGSSSLIFISELYTNDESPKPQAYGEMSANYGGFANSVIIYMSKSPSIGTRKVASSLRIA